ncbi:MAG: hypothetical protein ACPIOQ_43710 [Promethearchaeia archaeon]
MRLLSGIALALVGMVLLPPYTEAFRLGGPSPSLPQTRVGATTAAPSMRSGAGTAFQLLPGRALLLDQQGSLCEQAHQCCGRRHRAAI